MGEIYGRYFVSNGELLPAERFESGLVYEGNSIYEVLRIKEGIPVFFNQHFGRLMSSAILSGGDFNVIEEDIRNDIATLYANYPLKIANLKIVFNIKASICVRLLYYTAPLYPSEEDYRHGVKGILFKAERLNPGAKIINSQLRESINRALIQKSAYEALLVNNDGLITEGSRSNIFFVKGSGLVTAPDNFVLKGVTRDHLTAICREEGIELEYRCINANEISSFDASFMSGTSPIVLPFNSLEDHRFVVRK